MFSKWLLDILSVALALCSAAMYLRSNVKMHHAVTALLLRARRDLPDHPAIACTKYSGTLVERSMTLERVAAHLGREEWPATASQLRQLAADVRKARRGMYLSLLPLLLSFGLLASAH